MRKSAQAANLGDLVAMLNGIEGQPRAQIESKVKGALKLVMAKPEHQAMRAQLELVELNLHNLK